MRLMAISILAIVSFWASPVAAMRLHKLKTQSQLATADGLATQDIAYEISQVSLPAGEGDWYHYKCEGDHAIVIKPKREGEGVFPATAEECRDDIETRLGVVVNMQTAGKKHGNHIVLVDQSRFQCPLHEEVTKEVKTMWGLKKASRAYGSYKSCHIAFRAAWENHGCVPDHHIDLVVPLPEGKKRKAGPGDFQFDGKGRLIVDGLPAEDGGAILAEISLLARNGETVVPFEHHQCVGRGGWAEFEFETPERAVEAKALLMNTYILKDQHRALQLLRYAAIFPGISLWLMTTFGQVTPEKIRVVQEERDSNSTGSGSFVYDRFPGVA